MAKWADFGISKASFSGSTVEKVEIRADPGARMGDREEWSREQVVAALVLGARLVTMKEVPAGGWMKVDDVRLVSVGDELFVRTDGDGVVGDELGELD